VTAQSLGTFGCKVTPVHDRVHEHIEVIDHSRGVVIEVNGIVVDRLPKILIYRLELAFAPLHHFVPHSGKTDKQLRSPRAKLIEMALLKMRGLDSGHSNPARRGRHAVVLN
jgi:hypothetical protein